jgi:hypothetical protein
VLALERMTDVRAMAKASVPFGFGGAVLGLP